MALDYSDERAQGGEDSGGDSLNFTPETHHVSAVDTLKGGPAGATQAHQEAQNIEETDTKNSRLARQGALWASEHMKADTMPFTESDGCFTSGPSVGALFDRAVRDSGGVHQSHTWVSDPAPGVHRCVSEHTLTISELNREKPMWDKGEGVIPIGKRPAT